MAAKQLLQYAVNRMNESQAAQALEASGIQFMAGAEWAEFKDGQLRNEQNQPVTAGIGALTAVRVGDSSGATGRRTVANSGAQLDQRGRETGPSPQPQFMGDPNTAPNHGTIQGTQRRELTQLGSGVTTTVEGTRSMQKTAEVGAHVTAAAAEKHPAAAGMGSAPVGVGATAAVPEAQNVTHSGFQRATVPNADLSAQGNPAEAARKNEQSETELRGASLPPPTGAHANQTSANTGSTPTGSGSTPGTAGVRPQGQQQGQVPPKGTESEDEQLERENRSASAAGADVVEARNKESAPAGQQPEMSPDKEGDPGIVTPRHEQPKGASRPEFPTTR